jgi:glutathionylspermidine synthase
MRRESEVPRKDWQKRCEEAGFGFHSMGGTYWDESACYAFDAGQVDQLEEVTAELHRMCRDAAAEVVARRRFDEFAIPEPFRELVAESFRRGEPSLYGRFDFSWDGRSDPKLLEYNADTPTALLEASVVQWHWLEDTHADCDQFNSLHEKLIARWQAIRERLGGSVLHLASQRGSEEDAANVEYLRDCALQAGWDARGIAIEDLGWDGKRFVDLDDEAVTFLFKLYPWEWLVRDEFGAHLRSLRLIEPAWKMLLSNKALLVVLWELFPGHANLLPASFDEHAVGREYVRKPLLAREGANITLRTRWQHHWVEGTYGAEGFVYQAAAPLPDFGTASAPRYPVVGSWVIGDEPAGMGIREDDTPITRNTSRFVPHYFT